jgi:hypothetical protein
VAIALNKSGNTHKREKKTTSSDEIPKNVHSHIANALPAGTDISALLARSRKSRRR